MKQNLSTSHPENAFAEEENEILHIGMSSSYIKRPDSTTNLKKQVNLTCKSFYYQIRSMDRIREHMYYEIWRTEISRHDPILPLQDPELNGTSLYLWSCSWV